MNLAELIVAFGVLVVSGAAAVAAIVQAKVATRARVDAEAAVVEARRARDEIQNLARVSSAAFVRQAEAQERANELREAETRPPAWSGPRWVKGQMYQMINTAGRPVHLVQIEAEPDEAERMIRIYGHQNGTYDIGESFDFVALKTSSLRPRRLILQWRYVDEPESEPNRFIVPL